MVFFQEILMMKIVKGTHWVSSAVYFDFFGIEYIPQEVLNKIIDKSITRNIFGIPDNECECVGFIVLLS